MSQVEEVLHGIYEAVNTGNLALLDKYVAPGYVEHSDGFQGVEPFKQQITAFRTAFSRRTRHHHFRAQGFTRHRGQSTLTLTSWDQRPSVPARRFCTTG